MCICDGSCLIFNSQHYSQIQKDFVEDDHDHSVSVSSDQCTYVIQNQYFSLNLIGLNKSCNTGRTVGHWIIFTK